MRGTTSAALVLVFTIVVSCDKKPAPDPGGGETKVQPATAARPKAATATATVTVRVAINIDGHEMKLTIPTTQPAVFSHGSWTKKLALIAADRSEQKVTLQAALVPGDTEADKIDMTTFGKLASFSQVLEKGASVTLNPGTTIPSDGMGPSPPTAIQIKWLP